MNWLLTPGSYALPMLLLGLGSQAGAGPWDDPRNLKVLPVDISAEELRSTMRSFAIDTGTRCYTCHVGKDENDLETYDFSLDDKERKLIARDMIRLVADINGFLEGALGKPAAERVAVDCATCHRGRAKPEKLENVLERTYREAGLERALAEYRLLRDRYYGDYAFDFSPKPMIRLAGNLAGAGDFEAALGFLDLNLEFNPDSAQTLVAKAQLLTEQGDKAAARETLLEAIELKPDDQRARTLLENLEK